MIQVVVLTAALGVASGNPPAPHATSLQVLKATFGSQIKLSGSRVTVLTYCPDNTCEIFRARGPHAREQVADFALLYLWYLSQYYELQPWQRGPIPPQVAVVRERHSTHCHDAPEKARARCAFAALSKSANIKLTFSRYDEGEVNEGPVSLAEELERLQ